MPLPHPKISNLQKSRVFLATSVLVFAGIVLWVASRSTLSTSSIAWNSLDQRSSGPTSIEASSQRETPLESLDQSYQSSVLRTADSDISSALERSASYIDVLKEIAARISVGQFEEGENELNALNQLIDPLADHEKYAFLEYFIEFSQNNAFNPEVVTAFDALWSSLEMGPQTELDSAKLLISHYAKSYEFALAIEQFNLLANSGADISAELYRDVAYAQFGMHQYGEALPNLLEHIDLQSGEGLEVDRREYSMLFESYYRTGNLREAEMVGGLILNYYNDIQDWKDMQQFYLATDNKSGLEQLLTRANDAGLLNLSGGWID